MEYSFTAKGHPNILSTHTTTIGITKDKTLTRKGSCIVAVCADFSLQKMKGFLRYNKIRIILAVRGEEEAIIAEPNPTFNSNNELVIRKSEFASERTLAVKADKASSDIGRNIVEGLRTGEQAFITITTIK